MAEIMAPAGNMEQLMAAVRSGADRVYFGCGQFNARRNAGGFESPTQVIEYCHARGVKATAALNILLSDNELEAAARLIEEVAAAGGDGIIVQDLAAYRLVRDICPNLSLHGSTQMTVHNAEGAKALEQMGFARVVLARELSLDEIAKIRRQTNMELEVFVHGALCMSVSGQCYLSSMLGGRSGNRGLCAQPCRLDFTRQDGKAYALSLKDMSHLAHIRDLAELGVDSFKIEGRMKRPEYAAAAITQTRAALAGDEPDLPLLGAVFSRSGFTDGYITGKRTCDMFGHRVREDTAQTDKILPTLTGLYRQERQHIPVDMCLTVIKDQPVSLIVTDGISTVTVTGQPPETAVNRPLQEDFAKECLFKCGGTPYLPKGFTAHIQPGLLVPIPVLKQLRKQGLEQLTVLRVQGAKREVIPWRQPKRSPYHPLQKPAVYVSAKTFEQVKGICPQRLYLPAAELIANPQKVREWQGELFAVLPPLAFTSGAWTATLQQLHQLGIAGVEVGHPGAIAVAKTMGFYVTGGTGLNITNTAALEEYRSLGLNDTLLSFEVTKGMVKGLGGDLPRGMTVYGHLPLMRMRACPLRGEKGCGRCEGQGVLTDRKGVRFALSCDERQFTTLYNSVPLYLGDKSLPVDFVTLSFTHESPEECKKRWQQVCNGEQPDFPRTCGLFERTLL